MNALFVSFLKGMIKNGEKKKAVRSHEEGLEEVIYLTEFMLFVTEMFIMPEKMKPREGTLISVYIG